MYFGQSYLECSAWCLSVCHQKNEQNGKSNSEEYGRKKVSIAHWTSTEKLSIMGPNPIWIRNWYFFFLFIHLRFHKLPSYYFRKSWAYFGTWHFGKRHFGTDISSRGFFSTRTFCHENISTLVYFGTMDNLEQECYSTGTFQHKDVSAHWHFGTWTFWHCAKQHRHFYTDILAQVPLSQNVLVPKCPHAKKFLWCLLLK